MIFTFDNFKHILRAFSAAIFQPKFYNLCNTCLKELHVILNEFVLKMLTGEVDVIGDNLIVVIITKLKIRLIKNLVLLNMPK